MKICSATILYNPNDSLLENLATYYDHVDRLFIIDNSENENNIEANLIRKFGFSKITLVKNKKNIGIATALNDACELAKTNGFDWVLTMDQDSYFKSGVFFDHCIPVLHQKDIAIIAASFSEKTVLSKPYSTLFYESLFTITSGNVLRLDAWEKVRFNDKLFIDEVDNDFCIRLKKKGYRILLTKEVFLQHAVGETIKVKPFFFYKELHISVHNSPIRAYYITRNSLYVIKKHGLAFPSFGLNRSVNLLIRIALTIFFYPNKKKCLNYIIMGARDFLRSRFGKLVPIFLYFLSLNY